MLAYRQTQIDAMKGLTKEIPLNDIGMPHGIYSIDLIPWHDHVTNDAHVLPPAADSVQAEANIEDYLEQNLEEQKEPVYRMAGFPIDHLENAFLWLDYSEGFPTLNNGTPFWERLTFEPQEAFDAFKKYLTMVQLGDDSSGSARSVGMLAAEHATDDDLLAKESEFSMYYHMYYWHFRSSAYDVFRIAEHRKQQELRAIEVEDSHYVWSQKLMGQLQDYMDEEEDFWDMMTPKVAIDLMKQVVIMQRISSGLPASGPLISKDATQTSNQSLDTLFRQVAQSQNSRTIEALAEQDESGNLIAKALEDPENLDLLQKLIIESQHG